MSNAIEVVLSPEELAAHWPAPVSKVFADVVPVTVRNAGLLLREAHNKVLHAKGVLAQYQDLVVRAEGVLEAASQEMKKAEHRLKISALQPNGGEE